MDGGFRFGPARTKGLPNWVCSQIVTAESSWPTGSIGLRSARCRGRPWSPLRAVGNKRMAITSRGSDLIDRAVPT